MQAAVRVEPRRIEVQDRPEPTRGPDETLVRIATVAVCGGDLHYFQGPMPFRGAIPMPPDKPGGYVVGHEAVGTVVETSKGSHVLPGDRVTLDPQHRCGICDRCRAGEIELCAERRDMGYSLDGAAAELVAIPTGRVFRVPDSVSTDAAATTHGLAAVLHALSPVRLDTVERALVIGPGPAGLMFTMALRALIGAERVTLLGRASRRLQVAREMDVEAVELDRVDWEELQFAWGQPRGYDLIVDTTGVPEVIEAALLCGRPKGTVLLYAPTAFRLDGNVAFRRELRIIGSTGATSGMEPALQLLAEGCVPLEQILSHRFALSETQDAFERAIAPPDRRGDLVKALIDVGD